MIRLQPMSWFPKISMGLTQARLFARLLYAECGGPLQSVKPWRQADVLRKPVGQRGQHVFLKSSHDAAADGVLFACYNLT